MTAALERVLVLLRQLSGSEGARQEQRGKCCCCSSVHADNLVDVLLLSLSGLLSVNLL
jgi:hypothetical protein